jgi:hypothetical protein
MIAHIAKSSDARAPPHTHHTTNASGTKSTKGGIPVQSAMSWKSILNHGQSLALNWEDGLSWKNDVVGGSLETEKDIQKDDYDGWTIVTKGFNPKVKQPVTVYTSNAFNLLSVNDDPEKNTPQLQTNALPTSDKQPSKQDNKQRRQANIQKH